MKKYFSFYGKATISEFWAVWLVTVAVGVIIGFIFGVLYISLALNDNYLLYDGPLPLFYKIALLIGLIILLPSILVGFATAVRRCRDANINPWWIIAALIPFLGIIVIIVIGSLPSVNNTPKEEST